MIHVLTKWGLMYPGYIHLFQARHHLMLDPYNLFCQTKWGLMYPGYTFIPSKTSPNIGPI